MLMCLYSSFGTRMTAKAQDLRDPAWYREVCEFSRTEAKEEETVQELVTMCAGKDDEITKVFVDRNTRSGKSTEIKVKPKRNRKHVKLAERRTKPLPVRHMSRPILIIIVTVKL